MTTILAIFNDDLVRMNNTLIAAGAIITEPDGVRRVDTERVPATFVSTYRSLVRFGHENGLLR